MGGLETEVTGATRNVLLESALFNQVSIRRTSRRLGLVSDSSYRFERGVDPAGVEWGSRRAAHLIQQVAGGEIAAGVIDVSTLDLTPKVATLRFGRLNALLGMEVAPDEAVGILQRLGFETRERTQTAGTVAVPTFRQADVYREADLIEEVGRLHGYDNLPDLTTMKVAVAPRTKAQVIQERTRELMLGAGYSEVVSLSFHTERASGLVSPWTDAAPLRVQNPVAKGLDLMRRSLMPGFLEIKQTNQRQGVPRVFLFEIANVYLPVKGQELPQEKTCLTLLEEDAFDRLKGVVEMLLAQFGVEDECEFLPARLSFFAEEEQALLTMRGRKLGFLGRIHPEVAAVYDLRTQPFLAEIDLDLLVAEAVLEKRYRKLPAFPPIVRDLAIVVDEGVAWSAVQECVKQAGTELLAGIQFFDIYRGKQVPAGKKSLAFSITFQSPTRTLTTNEVDEIQSAIVAGLTKSLGAELRKKSLLA
jgi:phenylalanyl-tRNA synthetase beta chain